MADINRFLETYKNTKPTPGSVVELEVRLRDVDAKIFQSIFNKFVDYSSNNNKNLKVEEAQFQCSVIINNNDGDVKDRRELYYQDGVLADEQFIRKKRLTKNIILPNLSSICVIGLNMETPIDDFQAKPNNIIRFRSRCSFNFVYNDTKWRLDMTIIKQGILKDMEKSLPRLRNDFCNKNINVETYLNYIQTIDKYEIEIEYLDDPNKITIDSFNVVNLIVQSDDSIKRQEVIQKILKTLNKKSNGREEFRDLFPAVEALNRNKYKEIFPPIDYFATLKADGIKNWLFLDKNKLYTLNSNVGTETNVVSSSTIIVDTEFTHDTYYIIDVLYFGNSVCDEPFSVRKTHIDAAINVLKDYVKVDVKPIVPLFHFENDQTEEYNKFLEKQIKSLYLKKHEFEIDGIILTQGDKPFDSTISYKWKPYEHNTIDFYCIKMPDDLIGSYPYLKRENNTIYILFNSILHKTREEIGLGLIRNYRRLIPNADYNLYPVQFSPSIDPIAYIFYNENPNLNMEIVELTRNKENTDWILVKIRKDRIGEKNYYGNRFRTAETTFMNFYDLFPLEALWSSPSSYFIKTVKRNDLLFNTNKFNRLVINILFKKYVSGAIKALDLAFGQGADINRYKHVGVKELLGVDQDASAITEATKRKYPDSRRKFVGSDEELSNCEKEYARIQAIEYNKLILNDEKSMLIHTTIANLKTDYCKIAAQCRKYGYNSGDADVIVCNLAFHYMCDSAKNIDNFLSLVAIQLKIDGYLVMTTMSGKSVFDLLDSVSLKEKLDKKSQSNKWNYFVSDLSGSDKLEKYCIEKRYKGEKLANFGQNIAVLLPMTNQMVEEPLCNFDYVITKAAKFGLTLVENKSFADYPEAVKSNLTDGFTKEDWTYVGLYHSLVFRKSKELKKFI